MECIAPTKPDLLSELPTDVLVSIMENLSLRDAVRVGVLSRRWRPLPAQLPRLDLDIDNFLPSEDAREFDHYDDGVDVDDADGQGDGVAHPPDGVEEDVAPGPAVGDDGVINDNLDDEDDGDILSEAGDKMADAMTALLASRRPAGGNDDNLDVHPTTLAMRFFLRHNYMSLGRLVDDAVARGKVCAVNLTITTTCYLDDDDQEKTERSLVGYGRRFKALFDACPSTFGAVTQLTLKKMRNVTGHLRDILATCTRLEKLSLHRCGSGLGARWHVRHARLKDIKIYLCDFRSVKLVWLPSLESFTLQGWLSTNNEPVSFGDVPRLTTATLSCDICDNKQALKLSRIFSNNTALSDLRLNFRDSNIWVQPEISRRLTDAFCNLKNIKIRNVHRECGLAWPMFLLQCAPHLEELYIKLLEHDCREYARNNVSWEVATSFKHYSLAKVTILGFYRTEEIIVTFIRHLIEAAVKLEGIYVRENTPFFCDVCEHMEPPVGSRFPQTDQDRDTFRKRITGGRLTGTVKIHIQS